MRFDRLAPLLLAALPLFAAACAVDGTEEPATDEQDTNGLNQTLVLRGTIITMDDALGAGQVIEGGAVVVTNDKIVDVLPAGAPLPTGKTVTTLPSVDGPSDWVITPGLINMHNHLAYNTAHIYKQLPLYENTYQWRDEKYYDTHIMYPKNYLAACSADPAEMGSKDVTPARLDFAGLAGRYAEVKELVSGTTTTQGSYFGTTVPAGYGNHMARNLDWQNFGSRRVSQQSLGILVESFDPRNVIKRMDAHQIDAWLVHLLEGTDQVSQDEFDCLRAMGLVRKETVIIHGTALTQPQLAEMAKVGAKLVVSPLDNLLYYGHTADIKTAHDLGINVSLGTDWSPAGSKNLLAELKVLDLLNKQIYGNSLTDRDMIKMVTTNPADAIAWTEKVGRVKKGLYADLAVYTKKPGTPYRSIIDATEKDVRLVVVGGDALYGDEAVMTTLKPGDHETLGACGQQKGLDITTTSTAVEQGDVTFAETTAALSEALSMDPTWISSHYDPAIANNWTPATTPANMTKAFPKGLAARTLDPVFMCDDPALVEQIRTDPNIRNAFSGVCLDLRPWYGGAAKGECGTAPTKPTLVTIAAHPGTVPQRPAAWCGQQTWTGSGTLPKPPHVVTHH